MQQARERAARRASNAARNLDDAGLPKIFAGTMKRNAQESAGRAERDAHRAGRAGAGAAGRGGAGRCATSRGSALELPDTSVPAGRTVFLGERMQVRLGDRALFAGRRRRPRRSAARSGSRSPAPTAPASRPCCACRQRRAGRRTAVRSRGPTGRVAYLSQRLDLLDLDRTRGRRTSPTFAPALPQPQRMNLLARFLFRGARIHLPVGVLSGGERLRATLACVLYAEPAPQLLLLDEPTNNLDLVSVEQLESALDAYRGRVRGGQPRRAVPRRDRGRPLAAAGERTARGDRPRSSARLSGAPVGARPD